MGWLTFIEIFTVFKLLFKLATLYFWTIHLQDANEDLYQLKFFEFWNAAN